MNRIIDLGLNLLGVVLLLFYGIAVCPFLDQLSQNDIEKIIATLLTPIMIGWFIKEYLLLENRCSRKLLKSTLAVWILSGVVITLFDFVVFEFPIGSGLKVLFGCWCLGSFIAAISSLVEEKVEIESNRFVQNSDKQKNSYFSITRKFGIFTGLCIAEFAIIISLMIYKDLNYFDHALNQGVHQSEIILSILKEMAFVLAILVTGSLTILYLYSRNLKVIFDKILYSLNHVENGNLETHIPIFSHDEFGVISRSTNQMILGLKEKEKIRDIFGKYLSPEIANEILEEGADLGGKKKRVAILFSDIRGFTTLSENRRPEEVVELLNTYFSKFVEVVYAHSGVLDKFIGDAVMAIYGLDHHTHNPAQNAVQTAVEICAKLSQINSTLEARGLPRISIGVGVHVGEVIVGNIGSPERLEYTVIGDTVNTASRLESATKDLKSTIVISETVYMDLDASERSQFTAAGSHALKGKESEIPLYQSKAA